MTTPAPVLHATLVARLRDGIWRGVLLRGPSGVGKSDLALRLIADGWWLVADDRVVVWTEAGRLFGRAPATLSGLLELRGQGVLREDRWRDWAEIRLCVECLASGEELDRVPEPARAAILDTSVPLARVVAREAAAVYRVNRLAGLP